MVAAVLSLFTTEGGLQEVQLLSLLCTVSLNIYFFFSFIQSRHKLPDRAILQEMFRTASFFLSDRGKVFSNFYNTVLLIKFYKTTLLEMPKTSDFNFKGISNIHILPQYTLFAQKQSKWNNLSLQKIFISTSTNICSHL